MEEVPDEIEFPSPPLIRAKSRPKRVKEVKEEVNEVVKDEEEVVK